MLSLRNIYKWCNTDINRTFVLKDINLEVKEGEFISVMGPSGSGKSTLVNVIGMLDDPNEGKLTLADEPTGNLNSKLLFTFLATAQKKLSLKKAIETGIKNNIDVLQSDLQMQKAGINYKQSKALMLPDLNASANHGVNQGRSIDPFTNSFINQKVNYTNYGANSSVAVRIRNQVKLAKLDLQNSELIKQNTKTQLQQSIERAYVNLTSSLIKVVNFKQAH